MSVEQVQIRSLARTGTPEHALLSEADAVGDQSASISTQEFVDRLGKPMPGVTAARASAIKTSFLNTIAPSAGGALSVRDYDGGVVLPNQFGMKERLLTSLVGGTTFTTFDVMDKSGQKLAVLERRWASKGIGDLLHNTLAPTFTLRNPAVQDKGRNVIAEAKPVVLDLNNPTDNLRNVIHIDDGQGNRIGTIRERWDSTVGSWVQRQVLGTTILTQYEILDPNGNVVAISDKGELLRTNMTLSTPDGRRVGTMNRGFFNSLLSDTWTANVEQEGIVDRRVLLFMAAYKTWGDKKAAEERAAKENQQRSGERSSGGESGW